MKTIIAAITLTLFCATTAQADPATHTPITEQMKKEQYACFGYAVLEEKLSIDEALARCGVSVQSISTAIKPLPVSVPLSNARSAIPSRPGEAPAGPTPIALQYVHVQPALQVARAQKPAVYPAATGGNTVKPESHMIIHRRTVTIEKSIQ